MIPNLLMYFHILGLNKLTTICVCLVILFTSCKKKKEEEPAPPTPAAATPIVSAMTASVNGIAWQMANNTYNTSSSGGIYGFSGRTSNDPPNTMISLNFPYTIGTMTVGGGFGATYRDSSQAYHYAQTGTLTISELDTNSVFGLPKRIKGTFSFVTTTSISITNGVVDWTKPN